MLRAVALIIAAALGYPVWADTRSEIEAIAEQDDVIGGAYALIRQGRVVEVHPFGRIEPDGDAVSRSTIFRVGSVSKNVTSLLAAVLADRGELDLDMKVADALPNLRIDNPWEDTAPLRLVHLLEHTGGLAGSSFRSYIGYDHDRAPLDVVTDRSLALRWPPGKYFSYANIGHTLAAAVMAQQTGREFDELINAEVLGPLGIEASFRLDSKIGGRLAPSFLRHGEEADLWRMEIRPSGSLMMSIESLAKLTAFHSGDAGSPGVISAEAVRRMRRPETSLAAQQGYDLAYGLGMFGFFAADQIFWGHWGRTDGYLANFGVLPGEQSGFALIVNTDNRGAMTKMREVLAKRIAEGAEPLPVPDNSNAATDGLEGLYWPFSDDGVSRTWFTGLSAAVQVRQGPDGGLTAGHPFLPGDLVRLVQTAPRFFRTQDVPFATHLFLDDGGDITLFGDQQLSFRRFSGAEVAALWGGMVLFLGAVLITVSGCLIMAVRRVIGRAFGPAGRLVALQALALCALAALIFLFVQWAFLAPIGSLAALGQPGLQSIILALLSIWPLPVLAAAYTLWRLWTKIGVIARGAGTISILGLLSAALYLGAHGWVPLLTWRF